MKVAPLGGPGVRSAIPAGTIQRFPGKMGQTTGTGGTK